MSDKGAKDGRSNKKRQAARAQKLRDKDILTRQLSRRSILRTGVIGSSALAAACVPGPYQTGTVTVSDPSGSRSQTLTGPSNCTGITDNDYAPVNGFTDPGGCGRGSGPRSLTGQIPTYSDYDSGPYADLYRQPSGSGLTDSDGGPSADPAGYGRRGW